MWTKERLQRFVQREIDGYRLIVVSNRQPYIHNLVEGKPQYVLPSGGLTSALEPLMQACGGVWVAYGGGDGDRYVVDQNDRIMVPPEDPAYTLRLVWLSEEEEQGYYYGFSNKGLWPLSHHAFTEPVFDAREWEIYKAVNQRFAQHVLEEVDNQPAVVLTQDYHLALLPRLLRCAEPSIISGQFWHIPWPCPEIFRICPWQTELLDGLLGNNLLGFHVGSYCGNFMSTVADILEADVDYEYDLINYRAENTLVRPFPISVDFEQINQEAQTKAVEEEMVRLSDEWGLGGKLVGLGMDRIDYTKGIPHRLRALERFLEKYPEYCEKLVFVQAGVLSRTNIDAYQRLAEQLQQQVGDINARFGQKKWQPVIYMPTDLPNLTLMALRRLARFCVVSSLHDGMNLVAKEFVASRPDEDGVLILSPFTGAADELTDALIVNPYATEHFADGFRDALAMPYEERRRRMIRMRAVVRENNIYKWGAQLLMELMLNARAAHQPFEEYLSAAS